MTLSHLSHIPLQWDCFRDLSLNIFNFNKCHVYTDLIYILNRMRTEAYAYLVLLPLFRFFITYSPHMYWFLNPGGVASMLCQRTLFLRRSAKRQVLNSLISAKHQIKLQTRMKQQY